MSEQEKFNKLYNATYQTLEKSLTDFNNLNDTILRYKIYNTKNFEEWVSCKNDLYEGMMELIADAIIQFPEIAEKQDFKDLVNMIKLTYNSINENGEPCLYSSKTQRILKKVKYDFKGNILTKLSCDFPKELSKLKERATSFCTGHPVPITNSEFEIYSNFNPNNVEIRKRNLDLKNPIKMMFLKEKENN